MILRSPLPKIHYYRSQVVTSIKILTKPFDLSRNTNLQLNPYPNTQLDLYCSGNLSVQCTNPSTWLTPQQPFDWCSWFATTLHRNTNKIFNDGVRDFAWLQNLKAYKKCSKNSFFCRRRLEFQKKNLMKLFRVRVFLFPPPLYRSLMGSPISNRFTQTLGLF